MKRPPMWTLPPQPIYPFTHVRVYVDTSGSMKGRMALQTFGKTLNEVPFDGRGTNTEAVLRDIIASGTSHVILITDDMPNSSDDIRDLLAQVKKQLITFVVINPMDVGHNYPMSLINFATHHIGFKSCVSKPKLIVKYYDNKGYKLSLKPQQDIPGIDAFLGDVSEDDVDHHVFAVIRLMKNAGKSCLVHQETADPKIRNRFDLVHVRGSAQCCECFNYITNKLAIRMVQNQKPNPKQTRTFYCKDCATAVNQVAPQDIDAHNAVTALITGEPLMDGQEKVDVPFVMGDEQVVKVADKFKCAKCDGTRRAMTIATYIPSTKQILCQQCRTVMPDERQHALIHISEEPE